MVSATPPRGAMTGAREWWAPAIRKPEGGYQNEASSIFKNCGHRRCRGRGCFAGDRAVDAGDQMAHDHELAEVARHALRRRRNDVQGRRRGDRRQVPDSDFRRRRNRARPAGRRRRTERHRRVRPHRLVLLFRQGPNVRHGHIDCVRPKPTAEPRLVHAGRRQGSAQRVLQEVQLHRAARRQYRMPNGRLVPQGDQFGRRSQGPENAHRGIPRPRYPKARRGSATNSCRRHLSGTGEGHHRRRRVGRSLRRREARLLQGRAALLLSRLVGRRLDAVPLVNLDKWNALPKNYQAILEQAGHFANTWMIAKYDEVNPAALRRLLANGVKLHGFSPAIMEACFKAAKELHSEIAATNESFKKVYDAMTKYTNNGYQWFQVAELSYDSFMVRTRAPDRSARTKAGPGAPRRGRFFIEGRYLVGGSLKSSGDRSICGISICTLFGSIVEAAP